MEIVGDVDGADVLIVDDLIDTGESVKRGREGRKGDSTQTCIRFHLIVSFTPKATRS